MRRIYSQSYPLITQEFDEVDVIMAVIEWDEVGGLAVAWEAGPVGLRFSVGPGQT
jgi:hypothetical protein